MRSTLRTRLPALLDRVQPSETVIILFTAILVGAGTGLGAVLFIDLIALLQRVFFNGADALLSGLGRGALIVIPAIGGLLAGPIIAYFASEAKGHGVPEVMQAIALRGGRIRPRVVVAKIMASALCLGSGGSAGREGPIVQVGAALGSTVGQWLHLSEARIRNLVACGSAAGIAATFNAPIAGVIFAMEIILGEFHLGDLGSVILAAVTSSTLARVFLGDAPAFSIPEYGVKTPWEVLLYALLGIAAALTAVYFIKVLYWFEDLFDGWRFPNAFKPAVGGFLIGALGFGYPVLLVGAGLSSPEKAPLGLPISAHIPFIFGSGFNVIEGALLNDLVLSITLGLILLKPLATAFTLGSGNSGGVFAPSLVSGAVLGNAFGQIVERIQPAATGGPGAFALVGMAAVFAGAARAPFTAILIVFEMTDDYRMIVPLMAGVIVSVLVAERLHRESIYTLKLVRRGIHLKRGMDIDIMESVRVEEVMVREPMTVPADLPAILLPEEFIRTGRHGFPVLNPDGTLFGVVSLEDYRRVAGDSRQPSEDLLVRDIATRDVVTVFPNETVGTALRRMAPRDLSRLPVVSREDARRLVGVVRRNDIVRAYELGALRREEARRRAAILPPSDRDGVTFIEIALSDTSPAVGKRIAELSLPPEVVLVSIRRGQELLIPHGETLLQARDVITALCRSDFVDQIRSLVGGTAPQVRIAGEAKTTATEQS